MNNEYKLSVIVPVYNGEKYIKSGIAALLAQTISKNIEFILVDNASTDNSKAIIQSFQKDNLNLKYLFEGKKGVSYARNTGIKAAKGEFIGFFDIDDDIEPKYFENLLKLQSIYDSDMTIADFAMYFSDKSIKKHRQKLTQKWESNRKALMDFFAGNYIGNNVWDKIFRASIAKNIMFPKNYAVGEDMFFVYNFIRNSSIIYLDSAVAGYHYMIRDESTMNTAFSRKFFDPVKLSEIMVVEQDDSDLKNYAKAHLLHEECKLIENMHKNKGIKDNLSNYKKYKKRINQFKMKDAYNILNKRQFRGYLLMKISPFLYMKVHDLMKIG